MLIGDLFERSVTRPIPPVVYFHEQGPAEVQREVEEYIITGGYEPPDSRATPEGIHEQFVRLLGNMADELARSGGPELPACWISGFYGSGKSSFAKLLGLALDGRTLPNGKRLADALLAQDHSPRAHVFRSAWERLVRDLRPMAVVFDVGAQARDAEQIHAVVVRQVQKHLGYSSTSNLVANYELKLEREDLYATFEAKVLEVHKKAWKELKDSQLAEDYFSAALHALNPSVYDTPLAWVNSRTGASFEGWSQTAAEEAVIAIQQMIAKRAKDATVFLVVDEVSQYVHEDGNRMLALQSFVAALGQRLRGRVWLLATGQQKLEEGAGNESPIVKLKGRFPPALRVHLGGSNIREVVYRRLLRKKKLLEPDLEKLFDDHRPDLALHAYLGEQISKPDFVQMYPLLPGHIDLLLRITSGLRSRGGRVQGDAHEIRGLLQLLGDVFREQDLARREPGWLLTVDRVYDVLHTALDADLHLTLNRAMDFCQQQQQREAGELMKRVVKAVAMLELVQDDKHPTTADLVARSLYEKLGQGSRLADIQKALDAVVAEGLVAHSDKTGYKIESSAGQEWQLQRDGYAPSAEQISTAVQEAMTDLLADVDKVNVKGLPLSWLALFSDSLGAKEVRLHDERKPTAICVDFQLTKGEGRDEWVPRSTTATYKHRIVWVVGEQDALRHAAAKLIRSNRIVEYYAARQPLDPDKQRLLIEERNLGDTAKRQLAEAVKAAFMAGRLYFDGRDAAPRDHGSTFLTALGAYATRVADDLYPNPVAYTVGEKELVYLLESSDLSAPPTVFGQEKLGILALDAGRYEVTCNGRIPKEILAYVKEQGGVTGTTLVTYFGGPPHGVPPDVVRAVVVGLLRGTKLRVELTGTGELTSVRDEGARELLKDSALRKAKLTENTSESLTARDKNAICTMFKDLLGKDVSREPDAIADAVAAVFPSVRARLTDVQERFRKLPKEMAFPAALEKLAGALETCRKDRRVEPTVMAVKRHIAALRDGLTVLRRMQSDLTDDAVAAISDAASVRSYEWPSLMAAGPSAEARVAADAIDAHLRVASPWEDVAELGPLVATVRSEYRARRRAILDAHTAAVDVAVERIKRREGFDRLDADQRHLVLAHLTEGTAPNTDEKAIVPALEALEGVLARRRDDAEQRALRKLDELREATGGRAVVEVAVDVGGREIETVAELDRLLGDVRTRVAKELESGHRVRLRGS